MLDHDPAYEPWPLRRRAPREAARLAASVAASLGLHAAAALVVAVACALGAWWTRSFPTTRGSHEVCSLEASWADAQPTPPVEQRLQLATPVVVMPERAEIVGQIFRRESTNQPPTPAELARAADPLLVPPASVARAATLGAGAPTAEPPHPLPRQVSPPEPPTPALRAAAPQSAGHEPDRAPRLLFNAPPIYPAQAQQQGWRGRVLLTLRITAEGHVERVSVAQSSGYPVLDAAAASAARGWRFAPALRGGRSVPMDIDVPIDFVP